MCATSHLASYNAGLLYPGTLLELSHVSLEAFQHVEIAVHWGDLYCWEAGTTASGSIATCGKRLSAKIKSSKRAAADER